LKAPMSPAIRGKITTVTTKSSLLRHLPLHRFQPNQVGPMSSNVQSEDFCFVCVHDVNIVCIKKHSAITSG